MNLDKTNQGYDLRHFAEPLVYNELHRGMSLSVERSNYNLAYPISDPTTRPRSIASDNLAD